jgi:glucose/galactose transporter
MKLNVRLLGMKKSQNSSFLPMAIIGGLFFIFGFVTWLNGSLIPFLQVACELNNIEAYFVTMAFYIAYTVMALPMAVLLKRIGYQNGMVWGLVIMSIGSVIFIPAAQERMFSIFLIGLFVLATGLTILQTAANPYIVLLGPKESAAVRISIMGLLNKSAGIVAPIIFTAYIFADMSQFNEARLATLNIEQRAYELTELSSRLIQPYIIMAIVLALLALIISKAPLPDISNENENEPSSIFSIFKFPHLIFGALTLFFYVGVEVIAGDTIGLFGKEMGVDNFSQLTSYTMACMVAAYITGMLVIPRWISQERALTLSGVLGVILSFLIIFSPSDSYALWDTLLFWAGSHSIPDVVLFVALLGFANALVWPAIWPMALNGLGSFTNIGSALLIMGISGGAILPLIYGTIAETSGNSQLAYAVMLPCYLIIIWYSLKGHKIRTKEM